MPAKRIPDGMWKRGKTYYARFRAGGREVRQKLSTNFRVASEMLAELKLKAYRRDEGIIDNEAELQTIFDKWLQTQSQHRRESTVERYRQNIDRLTEGLAVRRVSHLSHEVIFDYREQRLHDASPRTINMEVAALNTALRWAIAQSLIGSNPVADIKPLPHVPKEGRALSPSEVEAVLKVSTGVYRDIFLALFTTGMRLGEIAQLEFNDVDWENQEIVVRVKTGNKTGRQRRILLPTICCPSWKHKGTTHRSESRAVEVESGQPMASPDGSPRAEYSSPARTRS